MTIDELIHHFNLCESWEEKYAYLMDLGKEIPAMLETDKIQENLVPGCLSSVWMKGEFKNGQMFFIADSDSIIVKGLIGIIFMLYQGKTKSEIQHIDEKEILHTLGLDQHLTVQRQNGLWAMIKKIKQMH